jgi:hypothetical protein
VTWRRIGEQAVAVDMRDGGVYELAGPAVRIWELLDDEPTIEELIAALEAEFEADPQTLRADTQRTVDDLAAAGLLRR